LATEYGIEPRRVRTVCSAVNAGREDARHLDLPLSFALLRACSTAVDQAGRGIEYCDTLYRGDITSLSFDLEGALL
jgi:DNA-binding GntR family transcriptional regulator